MDPTRPLRNEHPYDGPGGRSGGPLGRPSRYNPDATHALVEDSDLIRRHAAALHLALMLADAITAIALFIGLSMIRFGTRQPGRGSGHRPGSMPSSRRCSTASALVAVLWVQGLYRLRVRWSRRREALDVLFAVLLLSVVVFTALFLFKLPNVSRLFLSCCSRPRHC